MSAETLDGGLAQALKSKFIPLDLCPGGAQRCQVLVTAFRPLQAIEWLCVLLHEAIRRTLKEKGRILLLISFQIIQLQMSLGDKGK